MTAPPETEGPTFQYTVLDGDSLTWIAKQFGVSREAIVRANPQRAIFFLNGSPCFSKLGGTTVDGVYVPDILNIPFPAESPTAEASLCWQRSG